MARYILKKKGRDSNELWMEVYNNIENYISKEEIDAKIEEAVERVKRTVAGKKAVYAWSGGKDSVVLQLVMERAGVKDCFFTTTRELQYTNFREWLKSNSPEGLEVIDQGYNLEWLSLHPRYLFAENTVIDAQWMALAQWKGQEEYHKKYRPDIIIVGRRIMDGNNCGPQGLYTNKKGITRYSPLWDWRGEDILAVIRYYNLSIPPNYLLDKKDGWYLGSILWHQRPGYTKTELENWEELYAFDKGVVIEASEYFPLAKKVVELNK